MPYTIPKTYLDRRAYRLARNATVAFWLAITVGVFTVVFTLSGFGFNHWGWSSSTARTAAVGVALTAALLWSAWRGHREAKDLETAADLRGEAVRTARPPSPPPRWDHLDVPEPQPLSGPVPVGPGIRPELTPPLPVIHQVVTEPATRSATDSNVTVYALRLPPPSP